MWMDEASGQVRGDGREIDGKVNEWVTAAEGSIKKGI